MHWFRTFQQICEVWRPEWESYVKGFECVRTYLFLCPLYSFLDVLCPRLTHDFFITGFVCTIARVFIHLLTFFVFVLNVFGLLRPIDRVASSLFFSLRLLFQLVANFCQGFSHLSIKRAFKRSVQELLRVEVTFNLNKANKFNQSSDEDYPGAIQIQNWANQCLKLTYFVYGFCVKDSDAFHHDVKLIICYFRRRVKFRFNQFHALGSWLNTLAKVKLRVGLFCDRCRLAWVLLGLIWKFINGLLGWNNGIGRWSLNSN